MRNVKNKEGYTGAITVMENYLDGALADIENGDVENLYLAISCMRAIIALNPVYGSVEYYNKLKELIDKADKEEKQG